MAEKHTADEQEIGAAQQKAFSRLAERFRAVSDPGQVKQLGNELGRFVFGERSAAPAISKSNL